MSALMSAHLHAENQGDLGKDPVQGSQPILHTRQEPLKSFLLHRVSLHLDSRNPFNGIDYDHSLAIVI